MTDLQEKAMRMALDALDCLPWQSSPIAIEATKALRTALAQPEQEFVGACVTCGAPKSEWLVDTVNTSQEPVTLLPDGSAFGVMSFPLPESHWLYAEREYRDREYEPIELGKPILTREMKSAVVSAMRYAIRAATDCGKEMDFDPDALVLNAVYALCGPNTAPVDTVNISQECVDKTAKRKHEPVVGTKTWVEDGKVFTQNLYASDIYITPPKREWVGLTDEEVEDEHQGLMATYIEEVDPEYWSNCDFEFARAIEAKLKEKNT